MPADNLRPRPLGSSGMMVSAMSLGSWRTFEHLPPETGAAILAAARDEGINFFDDARYNDETGRAPLPTGYSEVLFGELFRSAGVRRDEVVVANKLWWEFWPEQSAAAELDGSLARMGFDHVDVIYANPPPDGLAIADMVAAVGALVDWGKARAWAVVNWQAGPFAEAVAAAAALGMAAPCAAQLPYSLVRRSWVEGTGMTEALNAAGAGVVASFCLEGGVLSGKYLSGTATGRAAATLDDPRAAPAVAAAADLAGLAASLGTTAAALALAFPFTNPDVTSVLFGATSPEQLRANCAAAGLLDRLSPSDIARLRQVGRGLASTDPRHQVMPARSDREEPTDGDGKRHLLGESAGDLQPAGGGDPHQRRRNPTVHHRRPGLLVPPRWPGAPGRVHRGRPGQGTHRGTRARVPGGDAGTRHREHLPLPRAGARDRVLLPPRLARRAVLRRSGRRRAGARVPVGTGQGSWLSSVRARRAGFRIAQS
jgi:aryl-alcohol dehydrogenase-like predicted oxidoreductase